jgi:hypothetical protein
MKKMIQISMLASAMSALGAAPSLAEHGGRGWEDWGQRLHRGGGAPAPEIGAGVLGMLLAGGAVFYIRKRARG